MLSEPDTDATDTDAAGESVGFPGADTVPVAGAEALLDRDNVTERVPETLTLPERDAVPLAELLRVALADNEGLTLPHALSESEGVAEAHREPVMVRDTVPEPHALRDAVALGRFDAVDDVHSEGEPLVLRELEAVADGERERLGSAVGDADLDGDGVSDGLRDVDTVPELDKLSVAQTDALRAGETLVEKDVTREAVSD